MSFENIINFDLDLNLNFNLDLELDFDIKFFALYSHLTCDHCNMPFICEFRRNEIYNKVQIIKLNKLLNDTNIIRKRKYDIMKKN
jgi:transcriptional accessory protein Tex/SPT6